MSHEDEKKTACVPEESEDKSFLCSQEMSSCYSFVARLSKFDLERKAELCYDAVLCCRPPTVTPRKICNFPFLFPALFYLFFHTKIVC